MSSFLRQPSARSLVTRANTPSRNGRQAGFAVLISLSLMSFVLIIVLSMVMMAAVETANAANSKERLLARENARLGMLVALGELQKHLGPDQRVTSRGEIEPEVAAGAETWTGVWDTSLTGANNLAWLVSGEEPVPTEGAAGDEGTVTLFPATAETESVKSNWIAVESTNTSASRFAYWVQEESVKARLNLADYTDAMPYLTDDEARQDVGEQLLQFPNQTKIFAELSPDPDEEQPLTPVILEKLGRVETKDQISLVFPETVNSSDLLRQRQHDYTTWSAGVMENPLQGGLKTNLTGRTQVEVDQLIALSENTDDHYLKGDFLTYHNIDPATGEPHPKNANPNDPNPNGSGLTSNGELVGIVKDDFFGFRDDSIDSDDGESEVVRNVMPIVTEASFRLGAFHTQSDTKHRIRFHADVEFLNPYPFPIRFPGEGRSRVFTVMMVPSKFGSGRGRGGDTEQLILSVEKLGAGRGRGGTSVNEELHTNLFNFDEELGSVLGGGATNNTDNETVMTSWMTIDNVVLQPGEVYHATTNQSQGLARDLGGYILRSGGDRNDPADYIVDPDHDYNKWSWHTTQEPTHPVFEADERVRVSLRIPENGLTFRLIPFDSRSTNNSPVYEENGGAEWSTPIWELRNIYKIQDQGQLFDELSSTEYSRSSSGSYTLNDFTMGFHFKLDDEKVLTSDPDATALTMSFDLRQPVWDFDDPAVKSAIMVGGIFPEDALAGIEPNPMEAINQRDLFFNGVDLFADNNPESHGGGYERVVLYPNATAEPRSVGSFQHLPLSPERVEYDTDEDGEDEFVQIKVGMPWSGNLNEAFDKYFFSSAPPSDWTSGDPLPIPSEIRTGTENARLRQADAASELLVKGTFNVNSLSGPAWAAVISRTLPNWQYGDSTDTTNLQNAFLNLSNSTDAAIEAFGSIIEDAELTTTDADDMNSSNSTGRLAMRYPLRQLENNQIFDSSTPEDDSLVEFLLDEMRTFLDANGPFTSVSDFVNSGVLQRAINRSNINGSLPRFSPAYITQASILEPIAPFLTVRSDTFVIRSISDFENTATGERFGQIICEAVVQRLPDRVDGDSARISENASSNENRFGRRFVIKSINWKDSLL